MFQFQLTGYSPEIEANKVLQICLSTTVDFAAHLAALQL